MYAIGIGSKVDPRELHAIAGEDGEHDTNVFFSADYNALHNIETDIITAARGSTGPCPTTPPPPLTGKI